MASLCVSIDTSLRKITTTLLSPILHRLVPPDAATTTPGPPPPLSLKLLQKGDDSTSNAIIAAFDQQPDFVKFATAEMEAIQARDAEDGDKLAAGIAEAVKRGALEAEPAVEHTTVVQVLGKSADAVAAEIVAKLGRATTSGCVLVLQGLSGTGKGTTVAKLQAALPRAVCWSNGNVFRSLTLLAVSYCEANDIPFSADALTGPVLTRLVQCLSFGKYNGKFDIKIEGYGHNLLVSEVANTTLKEPRVGKNIPTVAKLTQGEVIKFAGDAAAKMGADGMNVLMEGRAQTLDYVRTPHRFELTLAEPLIIGKRRAAQRMMAAAVTRLEKAEVSVVGAAGEAQEVRKALAEELASMA